MLHKLVLPFEPDELAGIFALQVQLIELACAVNKLDKAAIELHFSDPKVVGWITSSYQRTVGVLNSFAMECPLVVKQEILQELTADYAFWEHREDPAFVFKFEATECNRRMIAIWLKDYFEQFEHGIDEAITKSRFVNKKVWLDAFRTANPDLRTCPACDSTMKGGITVEHFLPQERYPVLSVHVANLVPTCKDCNQLKKNKDPLETANHTALFLPYHRHALDFCDVHVAPMANGSYEFNLVPKGQDCDLTTALHEMGRLFQVPQQWNRNVQNIVDVAIAKINEQLEADLDEGVALNNHDIV